MTGNKSNLRQFLLLQPYSVLESQRRSGEEFAETHNAKWRAKARHSHSL